MTCSVLICTYNRPELLLLSLQALLDRASEKPDQLVVVNGGDERADAVVAIFSDRYDVDIRLIKTVNHNLATSRNIGLAHCTGDIIAMTDDDAEVFPDWLACMRQVHREHPEAGAVGGPVLGTSTDQLVGKLADLITFPVWPAAQYVRTLPGVNISYKRTVIQQLGAQDEALFRGEDVDYNWRVQKLGYKVYFDPAIKVYHHHRPTLRGFFHQHYMYGRAYYLVRHKWQDMYCVYPHGLHRLWDVVKAINFVAALFYQPILNVCRLGRWRDRLIALPIFFIVGFLWKLGMLIEMLFEYKESKAA